MRHLATLLLVGWLAALASGAQEWPAPGMETSSAQALYSLPRDHRLHGGEFYNTSSYMEWHYFTGFFKDVDTGEDVTVFFSNFYNGYLGQLGRSLMWSQFATLDFTTGEFLMEQPLYKGTFTAESADPEGPSESFWFTQGVEEEDGRGYRISYQHANESWSGAFVGDDVIFEASGSTFSPGYIPATPMGGIEQQGSNSGGSWNPETMSGLSYYYLAPNLRLTGTLTVRNRTRRIDGPVWFEHQWGNYRSNSNLNTHYAWVWARFEDGDMLTFRQWARPGFDFDSSSSRYIYLRKLEGGGYDAEYALGEAAQFIPTDNHTTPDGHAFPLFGKLATPQGTWYVQPDYPDQFSSTPTGLLWEGATFLREGSPSGPKVANMFLELVDMADADPTVIEAAPPAVIRSLDGGLPELPPMPW